MFCYPVVVLSSRKEDYFQPPDKDKEEIGVMSETGASGSQGWRSSLSLPSSEDVARAVAAAATSVSSPRPSVIFSADEEECNSPLKRIQKQVTKVLKGLSQAHDKRNLIYNPEVLTKQKRQWASFQLEYLDHRSLKGPLKIFESMVVVGLPPSFDSHSLRQRLIARKSEGSGKFRIALSGHNNSRVEPNFEPQVLFAYPPKKKLPLSYRDLLSFCFPGGVEVHAVEKSSSMSELNEILLGQEHLNQSELSFVFRLQQGGDNSTLYGCCILMEELLDKPSRLISLISDDKPVSSCLGRYIFATKRCYCMLSRVPFFDFHFGVLKSIFMEERLERLTQSISVLDLELPDTPERAKGLEENGGMSTQPVLEEEKNENRESSQSSATGTIATTEKLVSENESNEIGETSESSSGITTASTRMIDIGSPPERAKDLEENGGMSTQPVLEEEKNENRESSQSSASGTVATTEKLVSENESKEIGETSESSSRITTASTRMIDIGSPLAQSDLEGTSSFRNDTEDSLTTMSNEGETLSHDKEPSVIKQNSEASDFDIDNSTLNKPTVEKSIPAAVRALLRYQHLESSEPSCSQGSLSEDRHLRSENDETDLKETSISGQKDCSSYTDILEWAKANKHGSLQIICEYYEIDCPPLGSSITFHPLEHLHPLEFHRPLERALYISGSLLDLTSCRTSLERVEVLNELITEEEAASLSTVTISCICGFLRLEHVLTLFAGALLEKQIIIICSNLGILSASVLSLIPLIRPYQWQSLLMPVLPNDMLDFLDAPVPYIVGVQSKSSEVHSKLTNAIVVDISKNQVKSQSMPQLPQQRSLLASLAPYHSKLVGESYLGRKRSIFECTETQVEAARGFTEVLRNYLDALCSNLRSHTITNVQSNDDKVSLLLKESFIDSYPSRDQPFMKLFVDTQLFSVHTDLVLSVYQKD